MTKEKKDAKKKATTRTRHSPWVREQVRLRYRLCRTNADKQALADELGIGALNKLYNLASRLGATGRDEELAAPEGQRPERESVVEDPDETEFTPSQDRYISDEFGRRPIADIAFHLGHSETATLYRARHLKLRQPVKHWPLNKVARWLGMTVEELRKEQVNGIDIFPLVNKKRKRVAIELVSTTSLGRWLRSDDRLARLREEGNADRFFLLEIEESIEDLLSGRDEFEACKFLSHGHTCMNPYTRPSFGFYCPRTETRPAGADPYCLVRTLAVEDLAPEN